MTTAAGERLVGAAAAAEVAAMVITRPGDDATLERSGGSAPTSGTPIHDVDEQTSDTPNDNDPDDPNEEPSGSQPDANAAGADDAAEGVGARYLSGVLEAAWAAVTPPPADDKRKSKDPNPAPVVEPPASVKTFTRWTSRKHLADDKMLAALDTDDDFRTAVAETVDEAAAGELGWLWLTRPAGWDARIAEIVEAAEHAADSDAAERARQQRLEALEGAVKSAERRAVNAAKRRAHATADVRTAKRAFSTAQRRHNDAHTKLAQAQAVLDKAETAANESTRGHTAAERALGLAKTTEANATDAERVCVAELAAAHAALDAVLHPPEPEPEPVPVKAKKKPPAALEPPAKRTPLKPPANVATGADAAQHLLSVPDVAWLIDGYNFAFRLWEDTGNNIAVARGRVERRMNTLASRRHIDITVVWDGIQDPAAAKVPHRHGPKPGAATVRFSRPGRTADDSIIVDCDTLATTRPVVVVTADHNLKLRAARRGANTLAPEHLAALLPNTPHTPVAGQTHLTDDETETAPR